MISQDEIKQQRQSLALVTFLALVALFVYTGAEPLPLIMTIVVYVGIGYAVLDYWIRHPKND